MYLWLLVGHLIGVILWMGSTFSVYWLLRLHAQAPRDVLDKLTLMERSLALTMDIAATLAIGCGLVMAFSHGGTHPISSLFTAPGGGWFHIKVTVVVLAILPVHGIVRGRVAKFSRGEKPSVPAWAWTVLLLAIVAIVILAIRGPLMFARSAAAPAVPAATDPRPGDPR